jgi:colanic acid/amylovoran biosynthesis glycosyltransferase
MSRPLRIAMFVGAFPEISETFILHQITGLLDLGHEVDIYSETRSEIREQMHSEIVKYRLLERTIYMDLPPETGLWELPVWPITGETWPPGDECPIPNWRRVWRALPHLARCLAKSPRLTQQALSHNEYGYQAVSLSALYRLAKLSSVSKHYDVVHAHFGPVGNTFRFTRALWKTPLVVTFHGYDFCVVPRARGTDVYHKLFRVADGVTVNCDYTRERVAGLGCPRERIHNLHVGLHPEQFPFRKRVRQSGEPVRVLSVGRLVEKKGIEYAIRAVASAREKSPNLRYDIVGDGPLRTALEKLIDELGLRQNVFLHGAKNNQFIQQQMAEAHIFMLSSVTAANGDQEGTPVSIMEAQASGLPVLSTFHSGIPEVVIDGESGFLLPERDVAALAEKLGFLIEHPEVCRKMGARGRRHVEAEYDLRKLNRDLVDIYEQTLTRFRRRDGADVER